MRKHFRPVFALLIATALIAAGRAQMRVVPVDVQQGRTALGLALRHLSNTGIFMMATAHPDDENNGLLVRLNRGDGYRTALATATRGNGGQNEIGSELFEALGVLRTEELAALHRFDGAEQYFTRAVDFGYSFSVEETFEKWGRDEIIGDYVRLIRTVRPDVIASMSPVVRPTDGGLHHQASAMLAREAFDAAGDLNRYPDQIQQGLRPWQPRKFYIPGGRGGGPGAPGPPGESVSIDLAVYDPLLGRTYSEVGTEARSMHKCQGQAQLLALPAPSSASYQLVATTLPGRSLTTEEQTLFDGITPTIAGLAAFAKNGAPSVLTQGLDTLTAFVRTAQQQFDRGADAAVLQPLLSALTTTRELLRTLPSLEIDDTGRYEIAFRLRQKEREIQDAILLANNIRIELLADDGVIIPGQPLRVNVLLANRGAASISVKDVTLSGLDGSGSCSLTADGGRAFGGPGAGRGGAPVTAAAAVTTLGKDQVAGCTMTRTVPSNARVTEPYWHRDGQAGRYTFDNGAPFGLPYRPTPFTAKITLRFPAAPGNAAGEEITEELPVQYRYEGNIFSGEKRAELLVVPALSVHVSPEVAVLPTRPAAGAGEREVRVTVVNGARGAAESVVRLEAPASWTVVPAEQKIAFIREDEARTVRFEVRKGASTSAGSYAVKASAHSASAGGAVFSRGYQVIDYPHIRRQHIYEDTTVAAKVFDVRTAPNLTVGYIMGTGDEVPAALEQLGAKVVMLGRDDLAWGDLSRFNAIVVGVRAYGNRDDLVAQNNRLLEWVRGGGTLIVQYNRDPFNVAQYGPYPAVTGNDRVTDENAPVRVLEPGHPVFNVPNRITDSAWAGWVQERGLYFLGQRDSRYQDLVELSDPFPNNPGIKRGALAVASYGRGRWVYVGLGLWRELPAGVEGAYLLMANLISLR